MALINWQHWKKWCFHKATLKCSLSTHCTCRRSTKIKNQTAFPPVASLTFKLYVNEQNKQWRVPCEWLYLKRHNVPTCATLKTVEDLKHVVIAVNRLPTCRNTGLILMRQTEQRLRGWQTFESPPDAVCFVALLELAHSGGDVRYSRLAPSPAQ